MMKTDLHFDCTWLLQTYLYYGIFTRMTRIENGAEFRNNRVNIFRECRFGSSCQMFLRFDFLFEMYFSKGSVSQ